MLIRPMRPDDVPAVERVTAAAFFELERSTHRVDWPEPRERSPERVGPWMARLKHLHVHDPDGCWVAEDGDGRVVGAAAALLREGMWGLSTYAVLPGVQARGVGRPLLDAALSYGDPDGPGLICSSHDPRAVRRYRLAGFDLHPAMLMWGHVARSAIPSLPHTRTGCTADIDLLNDIDRKSRGHAHGVDHVVLTAQLRLKVVEDGIRRAYVYVNGSGGPYLLAATDESVAREAMWAALAESVPEEPVDFHNLTAQQTWAIDLGLEAGLELHGHGFVALRGMAPPWPYIPSGHFL